MTQIACPEIIPVIAMTEVRSQRLAAIGYDAATSTACVTFVKAEDKPFFYPATTLAEFEEFRTSPSIGSHFHKHFQKRDFYKPETAVVQS